jgi:hypothetical protein
MESKSWKNWDKFCCGGGVRGSFYWKGLRRRSHILLTRIKGNNKVVPLLNELSTMPWRRMGEWMYRFTFFLTSALAADEWSASRPGRFTPWERAPGIYWIRGWVDPRSGLDDLEKRKFLTLPELELRHLSRPDRSQSLYRLSYPGSFSQE